MKEFVEEFKKQITEELAEATSKNEDLASMLDDLNLKEADNVSIEVSGGEDKLPFDLHEYEPRVGDIKEMSEEEIAKAIQRDIDAAVQYKRLFDSKFLTYYDVYHSTISDTGKSANLSKFVSSDVLDTIEWIMPSLMRIFFGGDSIVEIIPSTKDDVKAAELHQQLINYQLNHKMDGFLKFYTWFKDALIYGIGIVKIGWEEFYTKKSFFYEELSEEEFRLLSEDPNIVIESYEVYEVREISADMEEEIAAGAVYYKYKNVKGYVKKITYSGPWIENIPVSSFYIEPGARNITEANFVAHKVLRSMDYLRRMARAGIYKNVEKLEASLSSVSSLASDDILTQTIESETPESTAISPQETPGREKVWVWECWVKLDVDGDGLLENLLITYANGVILRIEENPFNHNEPPFEILVPIIDTHKFFGISLTRLLKEFQDIKTALLRSVFDNVAFTIHKWYLVSRGSNVDLQALTSAGPKDVIMTDDINGIREMGPPNLLPNLAQLLQMVEEMKQQRVGVSRVVQGLPAGALTRTATGAMAQINSMQQRLELIARIFAETGVKRLFKKMISLNQQFISRDFVIRVFDDFIEIRPEDLDGSFDLQVNAGVASTTKEIVQQQLIQLLNIMPSLSQLGMVKPIHIYNIIKRLLNLFGFKNTDEFIEKPSEAPAQLPGIPTPPNQPPLTNVGELSGQILKNVGNLFTGGEIPPV